MKLLAAFLGACLLLLAAVLWHLTQGVVGAERDAAASAGKPVAATVAPAEEPPATSPTSQTPGPIQTAPDTSRAAVATGARDARTALKSAHASPTTQPAVHWTSDPQRREARRRLSAAREALASDPYHPAALRDAADALRRLERWHEAGDVLGRLAALSPEDAGVQLEYATVLMRLRLWVRAIPALQRVVEHQPDNETAWHNLALAQQALGHLNAARRSWDRVIELARDHRQAYAYRGEVWLDLHEWSRAVADFETALRDDPDSIESAMNLSLALRKLGRLDEARQCIREILQRHPRHVPALNRAAELAWALYRADPAGRRKLRNRTAALCRQSLAIDGSQPEVRALLDEALRSDGD